MPDPILEMPNPILIVHGWSDDYKSFLPLKGLLVQAGYTTEDVFLGNYASMRDDVTFDEVSYGLQMRLYELVRDKRITGNVDNSGTMSLEPFSLDVIVHSTGGPVVRNWLSIYLRDICGGDFTKSPIRHFIMMAPANFGSRLAAQGKSTLAKLFKGGMANGFETGRKILEGLELGSPFLWDLAGRDLFGAKLYPSGPQGTFLFILSGTDTYGMLKGLVAQGASENGSDGTIRAASASLNSIKIEANFLNPANPRVKIIFQNNESPAFKLVEGCNHSTIVPDASAATAHPAFKQLMRCLAVNDTNDYKKLCNEFDDENEQLYDKNKEMHKNDESVDPINRFQQFVVRVLDNMGNAVTDYRLDFHVVDDSITVSTWTNQVPPKEFEKYKDYNVWIMKEVISDVEQHSVNPSYRTFFVNIDALNKLNNDLKEKCPLAYIALNLDALPSAPGVTYDTDSIKYRRLDGLFQQKSFFKENTSTLLEIRLQLSVDKSIYEFH
jgi:hypothetical protein